MLKRTPEGGTPAPLTPATPFFTYILITCYYILISITIIISYINLNNAKLIKVHKNV